MKYLSLVAVIIFISFTWWVSQKTQDLSVQQISKMNNMIAQYMTQTVQNQQPDITEIEFSKISTEVIEPGKKMKANFKFSYMVPNASGELEKVYRKGSFLITSEDGDKWTAQIEQVGDVQVEFMEPFTITEGEDTPAPEELSQKDATEDESSQNE